MEGNASMNDRIDRTKYKIKSLWAIVWSGIKEILGYLTQWSFVDRLIPFLMIIALWKVLHQGYGYLSMALVIFALIYMEIRWIRRMVEGGVELTYSKKQDTEPERLRKEWHATYAARTEALLKDAEAKLARLE